MDVVLGGRLYKMIIKIARIPLKKFGSDFQAFECIDKQTYCLYWF